MRNECAWPNNVERAVQTDPTLLRDASAITEQKKYWELLAENFDRFQTLRNNTQQQHPTTWNRVCKPTQHVTFNNVKSCWPTMLRSFPRDLRLKDRKNSIFGHIFILLYLKITYYRDMQLTCVSIYQYRSSYIIKHWPAGNFMKNESVRAYYGSSPRESSIKRITRIVSQNLERAKQLTATTSTSKTAMSQTVVDNRMWYAI